MRWTAWSTVTALLLGAHAVHAQQAPRASSSGLPTAVLDYQVEAGLPCPSAEQLRADVAKELTYDVFDPAASGASVGRFHVVISRDRQGVLTVWLSFDEASSGKQKWDTDFEAKPITARTCAHIVRQHVVSDVAMEMSLQTSRLVQNHSLRAVACPAPKPEPSGSAPGPVCPPASTIDIWPPEWPMPPLRPLKPDPPKPLERWPFALRFGVAAWPELVTSGWGSFGVSGELGVRYRAVSVGVEVHGDPPLGSVPYPGVGTVSFARLSAALLACGHYGWFAGCAVGDVGRFLFPDHVHALPASTFYGAVGARARMEFPVAPPRLFLTTTLDLRAPIPPVKNSAEGVTLFETAGLSVGLGLGVLLELSP